jgi:hypothetical protein
MKAKKKKPQVVKPKPELRHSLKSFVSSARSDWRSQDDVMQYVRAMTKTGRIGLDPCADKNPAHHLAHINYSGLRGNKRDGLTLPWHGFGLTYANPPYGRSLHHWIQKAVDTLPLLKAKDEIILLLPSRTDTIKVFHGLLIPHCNALCFVKGRLVFDSPDNPKCMFPSLVVYFGRRVKRFQETFAPLGWTIASNRV